MMEIFWFRRSRQSYLNKTLYSHHNILVRNRIEFLCLKMWKMKNVHYCYQIVGWPLIRANYTQWQEPNEQRPFMGNQQLFISIQIGHNWRCFQQTDFNQISQCQKAQIKYQSIKSATHSILFGAWLPCTLWIADHSSICVYRLKQNIKW